MHDRVAFQNVWIANSSITCYQGVGISPISVIFDIFIVVVKLLWMLGMHACPIDVLEQTVRNRDLTIHEIGEQWPAVNTNK